MYIVCVSITYKFSELNGKIPWEQGNVFLESHKNIIYNRPCTVKSYLQHQFFKVSL